jgi:hypothetical protein
MQEIAVLVVKSAGENECKLLIGNKNKISTVVE